MNGLEAALADITGFLDERGIPSVALPRARGAEGRRQEP